MTTPYAEIWVDFLPMERGGRSAPVDLGTPGLYRPHLRVAGGELLGVEFVDGPDDPIAPGTGSFATVHFLYEPAVSYAALIEGADFDLLEGLRVVAHGRVTRR